MKLLALSHALAEQLIAGSTGSSHHLICKVACRWVSTGMEWQHIHPNTCIMHVRICTEKYAKPSLQDECGSNIFLYKTTTSFDYLLQIIPVYIEMKHTCIRRTTPLSLMCLCVCVCVLILPVFHQISFQSRKTPKNIRPILPTALHHTLTHTFPIHFSHIK